MPGTPYSDPPTFSPLQKLTAALLNTVSDAIRALKWWSEAGSIPYSYDTDQLEKLLKPSVNSILKNTATGVPSWLPLWSVPGGFHSIGVAHFAPDADYSSTWADVAGASVSLAIGVPCTILVFSALSAYSKYAGNGKSAQLKALINGVDKGFSTTAGSEATPRDQPNMTIAVSTGISANPCVCKLQAQADSGDATHVSDGDIVALAIAA